MPLISTVRRVEDEVYSANEHPQQKRTISQSASDLKRLKIPELVQLLASLTGQQPTLSNKPRKPDIISKITDIATLRSE